MISSIVLSLSLLGCHSFPSELHVSGMDRRSDYVKYEINFEIETSYAQGYVEWLYTHLEDMYVNLEGFIHYDLFDIELVLNNEENDTVLKTVVWTVESQELLERYFDTKANETRNQFPLMYKDHFRAWRRVITPLSNTNVNCTYYVHREPESKNFGIRYCIPVEISNVLENSQIDDLDSLYDAMRDLDFLLQDNNYDDYTLQQLLYHMNVRNNVFRYTGYKNSYFNLLYKYLENKLFDEYMIPNFELKYKLILNNYNINNENDITIPNIRKIVKNHTINEAKFLDLLKNGNISLSLYEKFIKNYYINNRVFHLLVCAIPYITPLQFRNVIYKNCYDETGSDSGPNLAHPLLFISHFGNKTQHPVDIQPSIAALYYFNAQCYAVYHETSYLFGFGGYGFIESTMPKQMKKILKGAKKLGYNEKETIFWSSHISIDEEHGEEWYEILGDIINSKPNHNLYDIVYGGLFLLDARNQVYTNMYNEYQNQQQCQN